MTAIRWGVLVLGMFWVVLGFTYTGTFMGLRGRNRDTPPDYPPSVFGRILTVTVGILLVLASVFDKLR
jgi:hypothetical protein